jgi:hypothetical protein
MIGFTDMDNMIIAGIRIYFPKDNVLPCPSNEIRTFAVVHFNLPGHVLLEFRNNEWSPVTAKIFDDIGHAISAAVKVGKRTWQ